MMGFDFIYYDSLYIQSSPAGSLDWSQSVPDGLQSDKPNYPTASLIWFRITRGGDLGSPGGGGGGGGGGILLLTKIS